MADAEQQWETPKSRGKGKGRRVQSSKEDDGTRPTRIVPGLTLEKLLDDFQVMQKKWRDTACRERTERLLRKKTLTVTNAVLVGIGSFAVDWEHRYRSLWQLVLFMGVTDNLSTRNFEIQLYAQEPAFTSLDISFLRALNIIVLSTDAYSHISNQSFVFAPFVDWFILLPLFLKEKDPDLYIGNEILADYRPYVNTEQKAELLPTCNDLGSKFLIGREKFQLPEFALHAHALNGLVVYLRIEEEEDEA